MSRTSKPIAVSDRMNAVLTRLRSEAAALFQSPVADVVPLTFQVRESSEVTRARVTAPTCTQHVFAKIFRPRPGDTDDAVVRARLSRDLSVTRCVSEALRRTEDLRAVEPIACYEDLLGMVTKEAAGLPLNAAIARYAIWPSASRIDFLDIAVSRVGRWLQEFQRVAPHANPSRLSLDALRDYIDVRLQRLMRLPLADFGEEDRRAALAYFDRLASAVPSADLVEVPVHGDIVPSNVLVDADVVTVLDFGMTARGCRYLDVARLFTQLGFYTAKPQYRPRVITRLQQTALAGFQPGLREDDPLFEICVLQHRLCHFLSHARQPGPFPSSLYSAHLIRRHRRWLRERSSSRSGARTRQETVSTPSAS